MAEKINVLKDFVEGLDFMSRGEISPERAEVWRLLGYSYRRAYEAPEKGELVAWINFGVASELFWAFDIVTLGELNTSGNLTMQPQGPEYLDIAHQHVPYYMCAANKFPFGAALAGHLPHPDMVVAQASPCDSNLGIVPGAAEYLGYPYFSINVPYFRNERGVQYVAKELRRLVSFLEEKTGRKLDFDKLHQVMEYSNLAHEYLLKLNELTAHVPCPLSLADRIYEYPLFTQLAGTPELADYLQKSYERAKDKVARKEEPKTEEKIRLVWIYVPLQYELSFLDYLEEEYGTCNLTSMIHNVWVKPVEDISDTDKILRGLAEKTLDMPMAREVRGPGENYIDAAIHMIRYYKADGAVYAGAHACKANWAITKLTTDRIRDELNIPVLNFECDLLDPTYVTPEEIEGKLEDFVTLILQRKASRRSKL